ncbi:hypothetical protein, partial [Stutzerimonas frequens]|uniref:hypothetical protein n=1 Tax=Stutzerimonas frequens TaxID=2968969 RepID=UPI001E2CD866
LRKVSLQPHCNLCFHRALDSFAAGRQFAKAVVFPQMLKRAAMLHFEESLEGWIFFVARLRGCFPAASG